MCVCVCVCVCVCGISKKEKPLTLRFVASPAMHDYMRMVTDAISVKLKENGLSMPNSNSELGFLHFTSC